MQFAWPFNKLVLVPLLFLSLLSPIVAWADSTIDLRTAVGRTLDHNLELLKYPFQMRQQRALRIQAGIKPSPQINLDVEDFYGTKQYDDFSQTEITMILSQTIEMGGKLQNRLAESKAIEDRIQLEYQLAEVDVIAETTRRYYEVLKFQRLLELVDKKIQRESESIAQIEKLTKTGAVDPVDKVSIRLQLKRSEAYRLELRHDHSVAKTRLCAMWQGTPDFDRAIGDISALPTLPTERQVLTAVENSPAILHKLALQREADQRVKIARSDGVSDMRFGIGLRHKNADNAQTLNLGFEMPLNFENPNRGRIAAAETELKANQFESQNVKKKLQLTLIEHWQTMYLHQKQLEQLEFQILPEAKNLLNTSVASYRRGTTSILQIIAAEKELVDVQLEMVDISMNIYSDLLELERLTGKPMVASAIKKQAKTK